MNVSLTPELENLVTQKVKSGMYSSASEVIRAGLRLLQAHEEVQSAKLADLRKAIDAGNEAFERDGEIDGGSVFQEIREINKQIRQR